MIIKRKVKTIERMLEIIASMPKPNVTSTVSALYGKDRRNTVTAQNTEGICFYVFKTYSDADFSYVEKKLLEYSCKGK